MNHVMPSSISPLNHFILLIPCPLLRVTPMKHGHLEDFNTRLLRSEAELRGRALHGEDNKLTLQENVTKDREANTIVGLDTTIALRSGDLSIVDVGAGDDELLASNDGREAGQSSRARENIATLGVVVLGTRDLSVVRRDNGIREKEESGAGVSDSGERAGDRGLGANCVTTCGELPESISSVYGYVGDASSVLGGVDKTKVVGSSRALLEVSGEELSGQRALNGVEECSLLLGLNSVDGGESQSEQAVIVGVRDKLAGDGCRCFNCLRGGSNTPNNDLVSIHNTASAGSIAIADVPGLASLLGARRSLVNGVSRLLRRRKKVGEHPKIGRSSIEVKHQGCAAD